MAPYQCIHLQVLNGLSSSLCVPGRRLACSHAKVAKDPQRQQGPVVIPAKIGINVPPKAAMTPVVIPPKMPAPAKVPSIAPLGNDVAMLNVKQELSSADSECEILCMQ